MLQQTLDTTIVHLPGDWCSVTTSSQVLYFMMNLRALEHLEFKVSLPMVSNMSDALQSLVGAPLATFSAFLSVPLQRQFLHFCRI